VRIFPVQSRVYRLRRRFAPLTEREKYDENALIEKWLALNTQSAKWHAEARDYPEITGLEPLKKGGPPNYHSRLLSNRSDRST